MTTKRFNRLKVGFKRKARVDAIAQHTASATKRLKSNILRARTGSASVAFATGATATGSELELGIRYERFIRNEPGNRTVVPFQVPPRRLNLLQRPRAKTTTLR